MALAFRPRLSVEMSMSAKVDVLERLGDRTLIYAALADGTTLVYDEPGNVDRQVGQPVELAIDGAWVHLFDAESGMRI